MARSIEDIQREIERTREQLAGTLDELANRLDPKNVAQDARHQVKNVAKNPRLQLIAAGVTVGVVTLIGIAVASRRRERAQIQDIQKLLAATR